MNETLSDLIDPELAAELDRMRDRKRIFPLGYLLYQARRNRPGLSTTVAARKLRKQLRNKVLSRLSSELLLAWEEQRAEPEPWVLVEYLELLEVPLSTLLDVVRSLAARSNPRGGESFETMHALALRAPVEDEEAARKVVRAWTHRVIERMAAEVQMDVLTKAAFDVFGSEIAA